MILSHVCRLVRALNIPRMIPERTDRTNRRQAKDSSGGRPPDSRAGPYEERNTVEDGFGRLKQWRGIPSRYDRNALTYLGGVSIGTMVCNHRVQISQTDPRR